jgi:hypothetical protein
MWIRRPILVYGVWAAWKGKVVELLYRHTFCYISWKSKKWKRGFLL